MNKRPSYHRARFLLLHSHQKELRPSVFEPLLLREAKLQALLHCFAAHHTFSKIKRSIQDAPTSSSILSVLTCVREFRYAPDKHSRLALCVFRFLFQGKLSPEERIKILKILSTIIVFKMSLFSDVSNVFFLFLSFLFLSFFFLFFLFVSLIKISPIMYTCSFCLTLCIVRWTTFCSSCRTFTRRIQKKRKRNDNTCHLSIFLCLQIF